MKKVWIFVLALLLPTILFLEVWGVFRYNKVNRRIDMLEQEQTEWLEKNKRLIAAIAVYSSPERIEKIVEDELDLDKIDPQKTITIVLSGRKDE
ncbi:MAG: cell division protein FtsL [Spirochaetales bacterium]|nr:cell division protein FtsL [Spirochaetales bacterium]